MKILNIKNLTIKNGDKTIIDRLNIEIQESEKIVLIGSSGSGKTQIAKSIMRLTTLEVSGDILVGNKKEYILGKDVALIFQDFSKSLNSVIKIKKQMITPLIYHKICDKKEALNKVYEILKKMNLPIEVLDKFPYELSGGEKQRIVIAIVLLLKPKLIICDEISSGLDKENEEYVFNILKDQGSSLLIITHSINVVKNYSDRIIYLKSGKIEFNGKYPEFLKLENEEYVKNIIRLGEIYD